MKILCKFFGHKAEIGKQAELKGDEVIATCPYCGEKYVLAKIKEDETSIQETTDGRFVVAGMYGSTLGGYWIMKLNGDGTIVWKKNYGGGDIDEACFIQETSAGGFIVAGETQSFSTGKVDYWIMKLNSDGTIVWQKAYGGSDYDLPNCIQETSDGGFIVAGDSWSFSAGGGYWELGWILKLNNNGTRAWQKIYRGTIGKSSFAESIQQTPDGGFIVAGATTFFGAGSSDIWLLKLNSDGICTPLDFDTSITPANTTVTTSSDLPVTIRDTTGTVKNTNATVTDTDAEINQQAP